MLVQDLDTPCAIVDLDIMENNLRRCQTYLDRHGLRLRPHIKTHKIPEFAHLQIRLGAKGVNCQKLGEAEVMADAGITDILLTYNLVGQAKLDRLTALAHRSDVKVVADSHEVVENLSAAMSRAGLSLHVLVECDTGALRCGVTTPGEAVALAQAIERAPGLAFRGLMTYPPKNSVAKTDAWLTEAVDLCKRSGLPVEIVSNGGTPDLYSAHEVTVATEHRPGTYIYNDRMQVAAGVASWEDCALNIYSTVVSRAGPERGILDAGSKTLTSDPGGGLDGYGLILEHPEAKIAKFAEEHGFLDLARSNTRPNVGDVVRIVPNHVCVVVNMMDEVVMVRGDEIVGVLPVAARGKLR